MNPTHRRTLIGHLTFSEGVAAAWAALAAVSVGVALPLGLAPEVAATLEPGVLLDVHAQNALNPWFGHFWGAMSGSMLLGSLCWPQRQEVARVLLILSLVVALASGLYCSWALQALLV
ncbi:MAG TPA: hypothetical protein DFR83_19135 [Deltaproteobacteria bacterium]|nr:hypothetical protein [Deltaproteobacteria bacterium]|tara:strand:- start:138 stop:491 length:354 start_codon:yes stop_codon:yes gene_type:complete